MEVMKMKGGYVINACFFWGEKRVNIPLVPVPFEPRWITSACWHVSKWLHAEYGECIWITVSTCFWEEKKRDWINSESNISQSHAINYHVHDLLWLKGTARSGRLTATQEMEGRSSRGKSTSPVKSDVERDGCYVWSITTRPHRFYLSCRCCVITAPSRCLRFFFSPFFPRTVIDTYRRRAGTKKVDLLAH